MEFSHVCGNIKNLIGIYTPTEISVESILSMTRKALYDKPASW